MLSSLAMRLLLLIPLCLADQHVLLDTTKESMLDWRRYPYGPQAPTPGWVEESFTNFEKGINWRSYVVCDVGYPNVNNWLWTPSITKHDANRIYIEVKFSLRNCDLFPGKALQCKETFSLLYHEFDAAAREPDPWEPESFKQIDVIAADEGRFTNNNEVIINTETRSVEVTKKGVYFAFRDQGACLSLLAVKVYYLKCPEITVGFARYPETATGAQLTSISKVPGQCVANAVAVQKPHNLCKADGTWSFHTGLCSCMAGYEPQDGSVESRGGGGGGKERSCSPCPIGKFKHEVGNEECRICPAHSQALYAGSVECRCTDGYFRPSGKGNKGSACAKPPKAPRDLRSRIVNDTAVRLTWGSPTAADLDDRELKYSVTCDVCPALSTVYDPSDSLPPGAGGVVVSGLEEGASYVFRVTALGGVSSQLSPRERDASAATVLVDLSSQSQSGGAKARHRVRHVRLEEIKPTSVTLTWSPPSSSSSLSSDIIDVYEVRYYEHGSSPNATALTVITKRDSMEIKGLKRDTEYAFQVRAQTASRGWGPFSRPPIYANTGGRLSGDAVYVGDGGSSVQVTVGVVSVIVVIVLFVIVILLLRRSGILWGVMKKDGDSDSIDYRGIDNNYPTETLPIVQTAHGGQTLGHHGTLANNLHPVYNPFSLHKTYVDPHTYEDPNAAVKQFAKEIDPKFIMIEQIIGGGEFGDVCRGRLSIPERNDMLVAIKTLKKDSSNKSKNDFLTEASIMGQFEHPNVIFLQGVVTKASPIMIITEYMENGSLDTFLRNNDGKFQVMQLVGMMRGIAYGMQYLAEMNYVHRDLAARNVLVNSQLVCKIADFGLSREISPDPNGTHGGGGAADGGAYTTRGGKIPVRWTAPEAIAFRKFTSASDVWSFGIVMWEVMSYGERPYWTWSNQDVIKAIEKGYRLPAPMDCPEAIHQLMLDTWQRERAHRPSFASIVKTLDKLICCPETLRKIASSPAHYGNPYAATLGASDVANGASSSAASTHPPPDSFASVDEWLQSIKMQRYAESFAAAGVVEMDQVVKLSLQILTEQLGVTLVGHQKKIMSSIQAMRAHLTVNMSEGFLV